MVKSDVLRPEWIIDRQGKSFVLYAGLLSLGHARGLRSIRTEMIQKPDDNNKNVAIMFATVTLVSDGIESVFTAYADAAPNNVSPQMQTCLIRIAETRCKARALRDAVNVGMTAFEELGEPDEAAAPAYQESGRRPARTRAAAKVRPDDNSPANEAQVKAIRTLCTNHGKKLDEVIPAKFEGQSIETLTFGQAAEMIRALNDADRTAA